MIRKRESRGDEEARRGRRGGHGAAGGAALLLALLLLGCAVGGVGADVAKEAVPVSPGVGTPLDGNMGAPLPAPSPVVDETERARINWTEGWIEASGQAVPPKGVENPAQGKLLAQRGAVVDLQRNLLEAVKGVRVDSKTTLNDFMAHDQVRTEVSGFIRGVRIEKASWDGQIFTVRGRVRLEDVRRALAAVVVVKVRRVPVPPRFGGRRMTEPEAERQIERPDPVRRGGYTGLVIDCRRVPLIPSLMFRVVDESGRVVYGLENVDRERFLASGLCEYQSNLGYAVGQPRVADRSMVIRAIRTVGPRNVDIVIPNSAASRIRGSAFDFRVACRVILVKR